MESGVIKLLTPAGSLPARGAWIEMLAIEICENPESVAPRTGSVD